MTEYILLGLGLATVGLLIVAVCQLAALRRRQEDAAGQRQLVERLERMQAQLTEEQRASRQESARVIQQTVQSMSEVLLTAQGTANKTVTDSLETIRQAVTGQLETIRQENGRQLDQMRQTVDEKLQKTLNDRISQSFRLVNERLEQVYAGLGEMKTLANGVGDLKKVLSNVKTRGVLGEIQLGAILEQILSPEQYEANVKTKPGSTNFVEYAVKLPGSDDGTVWLPIDAKFPADAYTQLLDAYETGDKAQIEACGKALEKRGYSATYDCGRMGHGMGLMSTEPPSVTVRDEGILKPGMIINLEPGILVDTGVFCIEENYVITEDGYERLSTGSRKLHQIRG